MAGKRQNHASKLGSTVCGMRIEKMGPWTCKEERKGNGPYQGN
jgi:hypothetical protein